MTNTSKTGETQRGGSGNFAQNPDKARDAGKKGGSDASSSHRGGSGNFADDHEKASEAGRKGGEHSHGHGSQRQ